jgi:hypothetical protein
MKISTLLDLWNNFFFKMVSPYPVAAYRILQGLIILQMAVSFAPDLYLWFGYPGIITQKTAAADAIARMNVLSFFPESNEWVLIVWICYLIAAVMFTIGYHTKLASIALFIIIVSLTNRNLFLYHAGDTFMRTVSFWFVFAPAGDVWSVDSYLKRRREQLPPYCPLISAWGWRVLQFQMCLVYFSAFTAKTPGYYWGAGEACYIASRFESLFRLPMPIPFDIVLVSCLLTWGTLFIEFSLFSLIWIKELRYYVIALGICLHVSIDWCMSIPAFEWLMIVSFILFVDPEHIDRAVEISKYWLRKTFKLKAATAPA